MADFTQIIPSTGSYTAVSPNASTNFTQVIPHLGPSGQIPFLIGFDIIGLAQIQATDFTKVIPNP